MRTLGVLRDFEQLAKRLQLLISRPRTEHERLVSLE